MLSLPVVTERPQLPCCPLQWTSVSWNILGVKAVVHCLCLMDTLDIYPGDLATVWLTIARVGEAPASEQKLCKVVMEGLPPSLLWDTGANNLQTAGWRWASGPWLTDFLTRRRNKSDCNVPTTSGGT